MPTSLGLMYPAPCFPEGSPRRRDEECALPRTIGLSRNQSSGGDRARDRRGTRPPPPTVTVRRWLCAYGVYLLRVTTIIGIVASLRGGLILIVERRLRLMLQVHYRAEGRYPAPEVTMLGQVLGSRFL
jgi:hypothetical protein